MTELLLVDVVRGHHATGFAVVKREGNAVMMDKAPIPSPIFIGTKMYKDLIEQASLKIMIGHNRYATVGEKTVENSHPFQFPGIVGAHNGTLDTWSLKQLKDHDKYGTDSEAIYANIAEFGLKKTIGELTGAWALTWADTNEGSFNLLANDKRPLHYAYSENRESLFWASEADMLEWVVKRNKVKFFENGIYKCEDDMHYKWIVPAKIGDKFEKPVCAKVEGHKFAPVKHVKYEAPAYGATTTTSSGGTYKGASVVELFPKPKPFTRVDTKKFRPPYKDAKGHIINKVQFEALTKNTCVFCDECNSSWGDFIYPLKDDMDGRKLYLCEDCYNDDDILGMIQNAL